MNFFNIRKEDYKRYKNCFKIFWTFFNKNNFDQVNKWILNKEISVFFDLNNNNFLEKKIENKNINFYPGEKIIDGKIVGEKAQEYFQRNYNCFNLDNFNNEKSSEIIKKILINNKYDILFEPFFKYKNYVTKCDILKKNIDNSFHLIEVKSTIGNIFDEKTGKFIFKNLKKEYLYDILYQYFILKNSNINITKISFMLINSKFYKIGDFNYDNFFIFQDFFYKNKKIISLIEFVNYFFDKNNLDLDLQKMLFYLKKSNNFILNIFKNKYCFNNIIDKYCNHVTFFLPEHYNVFELFNGREKKTLLLYEEKKILLKDIEIPFKFKNNKLKLKNKKNINDLNEYQTRQINVIKDNTKIINIEKIDKILKIYNLYKFPIYMYDFETFKSAIPLFDYSYPYQQIPFQYSIHIILNEKYNYINLKNIKHFYYLSNGNKDPRLEFILKLVNDFKIFGKGTYVSYYKFFEKKILSELIDYIKFNFIKNKNRKNKFNKNKLLNIIYDLEFIYNNTIDLMDFFKDFMIYKKEFYGSKSIKKVCSAFDNNFNYNDLLIKKGDNASELFRRRIENNISLDLWNSFFRKEMIKYCSHDTFSMIIVLQNIKFLLKKRKFII